MAKARLVAGIRSMLSVLLVGVLLPAAASIPPAPALQLTQAEQAWLSMHPDITVAVNHGWEPISFISENGEMRGIALDYLDAIEKQLGVHFRRVRSVEDPTLETADILLAVPRPAALTGTRFQALPSPYIEMPFAIFTRGESNGIHRLEDLSGKKVAVFKTGTVAQSLAREHPQVQLYKADIAEEGLSALLHGSVDAYIGNRTIVTHVAHHQGFGNIKIVGTTPYRASIYLATRNDWPVLAEILQKTLQAIPAQENQRIQHNWEVIRYERETSQLWLLAGGGTLLAFISLFALWNWRVSRAERQRTRRRERTRNQVLELLAKNAPLNDILHAIVHAVELENPEMLCSILLIDGSGQHVLLGAAPRLPDFYNAAIHGAAIGPAEGSCGSAAYLGIRVVVSDIRTHPYWEKYRVLAERAGLRACWSEPIKNSSGKVIGTFAIYHREPRAPSGRDIRLIEQAANLAGLAIEQGRINEELQLALMVYRNSNEAMMVTDPEGVILTTNEAFTRITGRRPEEVIGKRPETLAEDVQFVFFREAMKALDRQGSWQGEIADRRKNGEAYVKWLTINTIFGEDGLPHRRVVLFYDITEKKKAEELIWQQANFDPLTGLPNRRMFQERLVQEMKKAQRAKLPLALLFLDLDRFKEVNDTLGHGMGDQLLKEAARRLNQCVRGTDTVARLGGDEFTVILTALDTPNSVERVVNDILRHISEPYWLGDDQAYVTTSIGITLYPDDAADIDTLLRNADQAMYAAKQMGRNRSCYFTPSMQEAAQTRMRLGTDLRSALAEQQLQVHYQPIVELATGAIHKAEALLRWQHPRLGWVPPSEFVPVAEETGLIVELGDFALKTAALQSRAWRSRFHPDFQISVNKSPVQFRNDRQDNWVRQLAALEVTGASIVVEITEGLLMDASPIVTEKLLQFRDAGVQVALDDFGTGYSSLSYLQRFDIDYLKIDRSFVHHLMPDSHTLALCEAIIVMAHKLDLKVIAEGVETDIQRRLLLAAGCDYAQGFLFSPAVAADDFERMLEESLRTPYEDEGTAI